MKREEDSLLLSNDSFKITDNKILPLYDDGDFVSFIEINGSPQLDHNSNSDIKDNSSIKVMRVNHPWGQAERIALDASNGTIIPVKKDGYIVSVKVNDTNVPINKYRPTENIVTKIEIDGLIVAISINGIIYPAITVSARTESVPLHSHQTVPPLI